MPEPKQAAAEKKEKKKEEKKKEEVKEAPEPPKEAPVEQHPEGAKPQDKPDEPPSLFLQKPGHVLVECGKALALQVQVDGSQLSARPGVRWFKGKWLELGTKSGIRFQCSETFDP
uniref:Uncharacterized protein n=1 Tax=Gopherus agassizii TaxID=38772 RepID=A0A452GP15_9SAUR